MLESTLYFDETAIRWGGIGSLCEWAKAHSRSLDDKGEVRHKVASTKSLD